MANIVNRGAGAPGTGTKVATKTPTYPPNQTLYITNLPSSKFQKTDLRISLYSLFSTYGPVIDVVALKTQKMSGQAHVVFRDIQTSTQAMRALQGFEFFGKELKIAYAKTKSDSIAKLDGTFRMPSAAAGEVTATELQQSIFNAPPSASNTTASALGSLMPPAADVTMEDARSPTTSIAGQKRRREEEEEEEDSEGDVAMEEDSDDDE
ncbi:RNA recognition domain-containing protein [Bisporella sp. PMI_857]|nr:RNA recognition domain-containing protein [Bisporella sp. PMI_857]